MNDTDIDEDITANDISMLSELLAELKEENNNNDDDTDTDEYIIANDISILYGK